MPVDLDGIDIAILKSLMEDGRKSFRAISREVKVSTPTVKSKYERLVNIGLVKSVKPEIDLSKVVDSRKIKIYTFEKKSSSSKRNKRSTSM